MLDEGFPPEEQFPRIMNAVLRDDPEAKTVSMQVNGRPAGDPLQDNRYTEDGYRFHDIFHLAHAAILGWSPTLRSILGRARKSDPLVRQREDGRWPIAVEEGIVAMVFSYAERKDWLQDATGITPQLYRRIEEMTSKLEVRVKTKEDWENAILTGYGCWRQVREWGSGRIRADLRNRTLDLTRRPPETANDQGET